MNVARLILILLSVLSACETVFSRAITKTERGAGHTIRKRSAEHMVTDFKSRNRKALERQHFLGKLLNVIDTSGDLPDPTALVTSDAGVKAFGKISGASNAPKRQGHRSRKNRKLKKRRGSRHGRKGNSRRARKNKPRKGRRRHTRSLVDNVAILLQSDHGTQIISAIAGVIRPDQQLNYNVQELKNIIQSSSRKCECNKHDRK
ncbi:uncharacterized protein LOC143447261 isoform X1 [Clavelina lepadiformis]|uniref:uncharacterized protein LOC143447261 isoform X1 n=2 Tax=Clavelina lepadiformis TaxID=159417 RepID=UPI004041BEC8